MKKKKHLYNKINSEELKFALANEPFERITASFYKYVDISLPNELRDELYEVWNQMGVFGRVYIADEGINAQVSIPQQNWEIFKDSVRNNDLFRDVKIKKAIQEGSSFYKLKIKVRKELVAYDVPKESYDMRKVGKHLTASEYNIALDREDSTVVDMRNYYESEIGRFENAIIPDVETSKELLPEVKNLLKGKENEKILLYCTGGIRCEKASSYLIKSGFKDVSQLQGGIIQYAHDIKRNNMKSKFRGKNFVFDDRLGERITDDVLASCHICGDSCDDHTDCKNDACHILFIQCEKCKKLYNGCCSKECQDFA
ncbi:MAG: rhodanese-related sulfurtransferase, partial [Candidatus Neomarinimicrobiota bacterium]